MTTETTGTDYGRSVGAPAAQRPRRYVPAVGPRLKKLLLVVVAMTAVLGANSIYLAAIRVAEWVGELRGSDVSLQSYFYHWMFFLHLVLGLLLTGPLLVFVFCHGWGVRRHLNRRALQMGLLLAIATMVLLGSGFLLMRIEGLIDIRHAAVRGPAYWAHVLSPLVALWLYVLHRLAGPPIRWRMGATYGVVVACFVLLMLVFHSHDPRQGVDDDPPDRQRRFFPALAQTASGKYLSHNTLMMNEYCRQCHPDAYEGWFHSVHRFSSFNNPPYRFSIGELREKAKTRDGNMHASRFCAGCHDPVPLFTGRFDDPDFDIGRDPTANAGITCTVCHSITRINSTRGNADYTIEEPIHYPFTFSESPILRYINRQLILAKPAFHKKMFLKPFHKTAEFCSVCHKVHLPESVTHYKEFLRGQNHYDSFLLSGVSGHGARSFYYPKKAEANCNGCHMPLQESNDFGARLFAGATKPSIHNHLFLGANTGIAHLRGHAPTVKAHQEFLKGCARVDLFGLKPGSTVDGKLVAPLRPSVPALEPGKTYLLEVVIRTLTLGHHFTQGTADSNQVWLDVTVRSGNRVFGRSGGIDSDGRVDPWAHFVNVYMLDRHGHRIDRRNAQDIFVPLYNHQIPPGAAQVAHYRLEVPSGVNEPIEVTVRLIYRKFDQTYLRYVYPEHPPTDLPITTIGEDAITFPIAGQDHDLAEQSSPIPAWQRWNDYGIALLLEGADAGETAQSRQAEDAFHEVEKLKRSEGALNLARVYVRNAQLNLAAAALERSRKMKPPAPSWTVAWFNGLIQTQRGAFADAVKSFESILNDRRPERRDRGLDLSKDYIVINELGRTLHAWSRRELARGNKPRRKELLQRAVNAFQRTLEIDEENLAAHHNLWQLYDELDDEKRKEHHLRLRDRFRLDEDARSKAVTAARKRDQAANHAAERVVIYSLHREGAPGLPAKATRQEGPSP